MLCIVVPYREDRYTGYDIIIIRTETLAERGSDFTAEKKHAYNYAISQLNANGFFEKKKNTVYYVLTRSKYVVARPKNS